MDDSSDDESEFSINSEEDLKNKLIEYEKYQNITDMFRQLEEKRSEFFTKVPENLKDFIEVDNHLEGNLDPDLLKDALVELQKRMNYQKPLNTKITRKELSVEERKSYIRNYLEKRKNVKFVDLFEDYTREMVVVTFLSILDMCKNREIILNQKELFGDILIEKV